MADADLRVWHEFYSLAGTVAATLMGLTFVVVTLAPRVVVEGADAVRAFTTPIVSFFATVVIVSLVINIPHIHPYTTGWAMVVTGFTGTTYMYFTGVHKRWRESKLGVDDWFFYIALPITGYALILVSGIALLRGLPWGLYVTVAAMFVLIIVGMRNAWDVVLAVARNERERENGASTDKPPQSR